MQLVERWDFVQLHAENGFQYNIDDLKAKITDKTNFYLAEKNTDWLSSVIKEVTHDQEYILRELIIAITELNYDKFLLNKEALICEVFPQEKEEILIAKKTLSVILENIEEKMAAYEVSKDSLNSTGLLLKEIKNSKE
jgi:hypothetical protein